MMMMMVTINIKDRGGDDDDVEDNNDYMNSQELHIIGISHHTLFHSEFLSCFL